MEDKAEKKESLEIDICDFQGNMNKVVMENLNKQILSTKLKFKLV